MLPVCFVSGVKIVYFCLLAILWSFRNVTLSYSTIYGKQRPSFRIICMNVTIHRGGDYLQLLLLQSHELQLYNLTDRGNISYTDCFLYEEAEKQSRTKSIPKRDILYLL